MKLALMIHALLLAAVASGPVVAATPIVEVPVSIAGSDGGAIDAQRGLILVPENRRDPNSRTIAVHYLRFAALDAGVSAGTKRSPVFLIAGGPGSEFDFSDPMLRQSVERLRRTRDVVYVSQRGNPRAPGLVPALWIVEEPGTLSEPDSVAGIRDMHRKSTQAALTTWSNKGLDLSGYDIINIVDDLHDLRAALGYDKIVLKGCSFGSQWGFAYLKRWPATVDRALLGGVEPLDYAYDSPRWLWASMLRVAKQAEADPKFAPHVPRGGLAKALQDTIKRLEKNPVTVTIKTPAGAEVQVALGAEDLRQQVRNTRGFLGTTNRESLANWPRFIVEMARGDYRYLAAATHDRRLRKQPAALIGTLIDDGLAITAARDKKLLGEAEARWVGDINDYYHNTRDMVPTPDAGDEFRADWPIDVPVLLVNGDLDWSTPLENARHAREYLKQGHLLEVGGGTHCPEIPEMTTMLPAAVESMAQFIDADFTSSSAADFFAKLPDRVEFPALQFSLPVGATLYDQWLSQPR